MLWSVAEKVILHYIGLSINKCGYGNMYESE